MSYVHPWLGSLWRHNEDQLLAGISISPTIRPARLNGHTDAEVLITVGSLTTGPELDAVLADASNRIQTALGQLETVKTFAVAHAPDGWRRHYEKADPSPLVDRLFLEGFDLNHEKEMKVTFDFGDLDLLVVRLDSDGHPQAVYLIG